MLSKLLKYDLNASWRQFAPLYAGSIALSVLYALASRQTIFPWISDLLGSLTFLAFPAVLGITFVLAVVSFYRSFLTDEAYLSFTLPVHTWQMILSKTLTAFFFAACSVLVSFLMVGLIDLVSGSRLLLEMREMLELVLDFSARQPHIRSLLFMALSLVILSYGMLLLRSYSALALAQAYDLFKNRIASGALYYVVFKIVEGLFFLGLVKIVSLTWQNRLDLQALENIENSFSLQLVPVLHSLLASMVVFSLLGIALYALVTHFLLTDKRNVA